MARPQESIHTQRVQKVTRVNFHNGIQIANKVYNSIDSVKHKAKMTTRFDGILIQMGGIDTVTTIGNIHSYILEQDASE